MANSYFKFKRFVIEQELAAMKVGTDGVLIGAWANCDNAKTILDVGTGTGLIALMCAQKNDIAVIDALEIDKIAFCQALVNVENSPWENRIELYHDSFQSFPTKCEKKYDLIVSNPPFFNNSLKNVCVQKSLARHTEALSYSDLIEGTTALLNKNGRFAVVLPYEVWLDFKSMAVERGLFLHRLLRVKPTPMKKEKRVLMEFGFTKVDVVDERVLIVEEFGRHGYSEDYKNLTKDFYLKF